MTSSPENDLAALQARWKDMFQKQLPEAATSKSTSQPKWSVHVDHCFARIILDLVVGKGEQPWMKTLKAPAYKNMSREQLEEAITLGEDILEGRVDLVELDEKSLALRGKASKVKKKDGKLDERTSHAKGSLEKLAYEKPTERKDGLKDEKREDSSSRKRSRSPDTSSARPSKASKLSANAPQSKRKPTTTDPETVALLDKIDSSPEIKTPFRRQVLSLLLQIPPGHYSTYALMSKHLSSSPRAVGNALRNNPLAPEVPCHRILATGGGLGGFGGSWGRKGEEGKNDAEKRRLLRAEGVKFAGDGRVVGSPWGNFA